MTPAELFARAAVTYPRVYIKITTQGESLDYIVFTIMFNDRKYNSSVSKDRWGIWKASGVAWFELSDMSDQETMKLFCDMFQCMSWFIAELNGE